MKYLNSIFAFLILASSTAFSQAGSAGFQILRLGYSARDLSLANSADAITKEPIAVFINPAGLASDESENGIGLDFMPKEMPPLSKRVPNKSMVVPAM